MAIIRSGNGSPLLEVNTSYLAFNSSYRGPEVGNGGYYRASLVSGTIAAATAAGSIFFGFQNPSTASNISIVSNISVGFRAVAGSASISFISSLYFTRSYTVLDTTGAATAPAFKGQMLTQTSATQLNSLYRISNTGALSGGTGTDDSQPLSSLIFTHPGIISTLGNQSFIQPNMNGLVTPVSPIICAPGEGLRVRFDTTPLGGTNTFVAFVDVEWLETSTF